MQNQIQNNWQETTLAGTATLNYGKGLPEATRTTGVVPVYGSSGITGYNNEALVNEPGYVVGRKGTVGSIYCSKIPFYPIDTVYYSTKSDIKCDFNFFYYLLKTLKLNKLDSDSAVPGLNRETAYTQKVLLPSISEQIKIASILSAFDDKIEVNNKIAKTLEEMAQTLFKEWFVKFKFPGHEKAEFVDSELGKIPEGWEIKTLGNVTINFDRKRKPLSNMERAGKKGHYPYYGATEVMDYIDEYIFDGEYLLIAEDGTVETNDGKAVLQFIERKFWVNNHAHIIQGTNEAPTFFLYLLFKYMSIKPYITGAVQLKLTQENLNKIPVIIPPGDVMNQFTRIVYPIILEIRKNNDENQKLAALRDLLLPKLMKGEIRI